jgi:hypothetical protein
MAKFISLQSLTDRQLKAQLHNVLDDLAEVLIEARRRDEEEKAK